MQRTFKIYHYMNLVFLGLALIYWTTETNTPQFFFLIGTAGTMLLLLVHRYYAHSYSLVFIAYIVFVIGLFRFIPDSSTLLAGILLAVLLPPATFLYGIMYSFWLIYISILVKNYIQLNMPLEFLYSFQEEIVLVTFQEWLWLILLCGYIVSVLPFYIGKTATISTRFHFVTGLIVFILTIPLQFIIGIGTGIYQSMKNHVIAFRENVGLQTFSEASSNSQPAFENYWLRKCYSDCKAIFQDVKEENKDTKEALSDEAKYIYDIHQFSLGAVPTTTLRVASYSSLIIGFLLLSTFTAVHFAVIGVISLFVFLYYLVFSLYDTYHLRRNKVSTICPSCYHQSQLPTYICFACEREHTDLRPGKFGIRKRKCLCETLLPATTLDDRHQLHAKCQNETCQTNLATKEATPFSISVVGAPSSGKTSFITSAIHEIQEKVVPKYQWKLEFLNTQDESFLNKQSKALIQGHYPSKTVEKKPLAYNLRLTGGKWRNPKLLYIYDPAGEAYSDSRELRSHDYFEHIDGYVLMIDPFSLPEVAARYDAENSYDLADVKPSATLPEDTYHMLMIHLATKYQIKETEKVDVPLAIVIHKVDAFQLEDEIAATRLPGEGNDKQNVVHEQCKAFLNGVGYGMLIQQIENKFNTFQFFTSSSADLNEYSEERTAQAITWLLEQK